MQVFDKFNAVKYKINFTTVTHEACFWLLMLVLMVLADGAGEDADSSKGRIEIQEMVGSYCSFKTSDSMRQNHHSV